MYISVYAYITFTPPWATALAQCTHLPSVVTWYTRAPVYGRASPVGAAAEGWHEGATGTFILLYVDVYI